MCFSFNNNAPSGATVTQNIDGLCMKYGVGFYKRVGNNKTKLNNNTLPSDNLPKTASKTFDGYYYNYIDPVNSANNKTIQIVDASGKIVITTNFFDSTHDTNGVILFEAKWK